MTTASTSHLFFSPWEWIEKGETIPSTLVTTINGRKHFLVAKPNRNFEGDVAESERIEREILKRIIDEELCQLLSANDFNLSWFVECSSHDEDTRKAIAKSRVILEATQNICFLIQMISNEYDRLSKHGYTTKKLRNESLIWVNLEESIRTKNKYASLEDLGMHNEILLGIFVL